MPRPVRPRSPCSIPHPGGGTSGATTFTIQPAQSFFFDAFDRPNSNNLGNGWVEKSPQAFDLAGGQASKQATGTGYLDNVVYRPASEDVLDVEASVELQVGTLPPGYPQLFTRLQSGTAGTPGSLDGYLLYVDGGASEAVLARQNGFNITTLASFGLTPNLNTTDTFRLRMRTTGTNPVVIDAFIERLDAANWITIGQTSVTDATPTRIDTAGSVGFGGFIEAAYNYDNFSRNDLGAGGNPIPVVTDLNPDTATEGGTAFALTVNGAGFVADSVVRWNGADRATTFVSETELQATITTADVATAGTADVAVFTPAPGGGTSGALTFTIEAVGGNNPTPTLASLIPLSAEEGGPAFDMTINGADFVPGSIVRWNGADRTTTFVSSNQLQAAVTAADIAAAGTAAVTVFNPAPGGGTSGAITFTIDPAVVNNPVPTMGTINPSTATEGDPAFSLTVNGTNFVAASVVRWNGADRTTTFVSGNQLLADITAADIGAVGTAAVTVFNPAPGGGTTVAATFTIQSGGPSTGAPEITGTNPQGAQTNSGSTTVTILGNNFTDQSTVLWNNAARATTFLSDQAIEFDIPAGDLANADVATITVSTPGPTGGISNPYPFIVVPPTSSFFFDDFETADSPTIGNDWTEKNPSAFSIEDGTVVGIETPVTEVFRDNIVYRPAAEDAADVNVSLEFVRDPNPPVYTRFPQVHARIQRSTVGIPNLIQSYILFVDDVLNDNTGGYLVLAISPNLVGIEECFLTQILIPENLVYGERYRLRFSVAGTDPVELDGYLDRFDGTEWQEIVSATASHDENTPLPPLFCEPGFLPPPLTTGGSFGFSKYWNRSDIYDNFYWINNDVTSTLPVIGSISPSSAEAGAPGVTLFVDGARFAAGSIVRWNGADRPTTFISSTGLQATISAADLASVGTAAVTVVTPGANGGESNTVNFDIVPPGTLPNPEPVLVSSAPQAVLAGSGSTVIDVQGSDFVPQSVVRLNGVDVPTTYNSAVSLSATIAAADLTNPGTAALTVFSPAPDGGTSAPISLAIIEADEFIDDFTRPDSNALGNGWTEKAPTGFEILGNQLAKTAVTTGYLDNFAYRPPAEDVLNGETSVEFQLTGAPGYPQIFTRLQQATAGLAGTADGYMMYINNNLSQAVIGRQIGANFVEGLVNVNLTEPLDTSSVFRMRLRATGTDPVVVEGFIERLGENGFQVIGSASANDSAGNRITNAGAGAVGGFIEATYLYDRFRVRDLD